MVKVGIIGGYGLEDPNFFRLKKIVKIDTPYGSPSSKLHIGTIKGVEVIMISRHGKNHNIMPTNVPNQANIYALKNKGPDIIRTLPIHRFYIERVPGVP